MKLPIAKFEVGFIDDPMLRVSLNIYVCGCWHNCSGCQNPELQKVENSYTVWYKLEDIYRKIDESLPLIESVVYLGGDFAYYPQELTEIAKYVENKKIYNVLYTGFVLEDIVNQEFMKYMDVIIDGKYEEKLKQDIFPASSNQRVFIKIDDEFVEILPKSLPINNR